MKKIIALMVMSFASTAALASSMALNPCKDSQLVGMKETIKEKKADGFVNAKVMKNNKNQVVGLYVWNKTADEIYAEVCQYLDTDDQTVANSWYYWEGDKLEANPSSWKKNGQYLIQQDEGSATLTMVKESVRGDVTVKIEIVGVDEILVKSQVVKFANP